MPRFKDCPYCGARNNVYAPQCSSCFRSLVFEMPWTVSVSTILILGVLAYLMFYLLEILRSKLS